MRSLEKVSHASSPIESPDTDGAGWARSDRKDRIIYGKPGEAPLFALSCLAIGDHAALEVERMAPADPNAMGVLALIGNRHVARIFVDAVGEGQRWHWLGLMPLEDPGVDALAGTGPVEATVPGGGTLVLNPSPMPAELIAQCEARMRPRDQPVPPGATE